MRKHNEKSNLCPMDNFYNMHYCFYHIFLCGRKYSGDMESVFHCNAVSRNFLFGGHCFMGIGSLEVKEEINTRSVEGEAR